MKKKIIITGGLGYIGTELCKIYSGYSWNDQITVIDNRFISERVNQIRNWNMNFVQGDILDKELIYTHCHDADSVHHLAGITDVPRVKSESNHEHEKKIKKVQKMFLGCPKRHTQKVLKKWSPGQWGPSPGPGSRRRGPGPGRGTAPWARAWARAPLSRRPFFEYFLSMCFGHPKTIF